MHFKQELQQHLESHGETYSKVSQQIQDHFKTYGLSCTLEASGIENDSQALEIYKGKLDPEACSFRFKPDLTLNFYTSFPVAIDLKGKNQVNYGTQNISYQAHEYIIHKQQYRLAYLCYYTPQDELRFINVKSINYPVINIMPVKGLSRDDVRANIETLMLANGHDPNHYTPKNECACKGSNYPYLLVPMIRSISLDQFLMEVVQAGGSSV